MTAAGRQTGRRFDAPLAELIAEAAALRDSAHGRLLSYSRKVFIPLTKLCRDVCHYCTFAHVPRAGKPVYLSPDEVLTIARAGAAAGCTEALFTLGDKPELRYQTARDALKALGHETTISYLTAMCALVLRETGLLPHANPGVMTREEIAGLREVTASQGIMLESTSARLCRQGGVHYGSPDKHPAVRLETLRLAGELNVPFTTGILIGIGETRDERIDALEAIRDLHATHGHIQEVIVQNFRAKPETKLANSEEPDLDDLLWTIATARLILGPDMNIQAPPNLSPGVYQKLIAAGLNDWGGISPVTLDHVNPEAPWPAIAELARKSADAGKLLVNRLPVYPAYVRAADIWLAPAIANPRAAHERHRRLRARRRLGSRQHRAATGAAGARPHRRRRNRWNRRASYVGRTARPERHLAPVRGTRRRLPVRHAGRQHAATRNQRRRRALRREPQHQLHEHLHLPVQVLRLLERPHARRFARFTL